LTVIIFPSLYSVVLDVFFFLLLLQLYLSIILFIVSYQIFSSLFIVSIIVITRRDRSVSLSCRTVSFLLSLRVLLVLLRPMILPLPLYVIVRVIAILFVFVFVYFSVQPYLSIRLLIVSYRIYSSLLMCRSDLISQLALLVLLRPTTSTSTPTDDTPTPSSDRGIDT